MTDGQYNDLDNTQIDRIPGMSNADNELGPVIPASGKNRAFRYDPNDPNNRLYCSVTGCTLADVAMYYWNRDLINSQFSYKTPVFGGFSAKVAFITKGDNNNKAKYDLNLMYDNGPLSAAVAYNKTQDSKASYALGAKYNFALSAIISIVCKGAIVGVFPCPKRSIHNIL